MSITVKIPNPSPSDLLDGNRKWATQLEERIPGFFGSSAGEQQPRVSHVIIFHAKRDEPRRYITSLKPKQVIWIGCVDSRVPETLLTNALPGQIFTHRNIAK